jgi:hypothetical protein
MLTTSRNKFMGNVETIIATSQRLMTELNLGQSAFAEIDDYHTHRMLKRREAQDFLHATEPAYASAAMSLPVDVVRLRAALDKPEAPPGYMLPDYRAACLSQFMG